MLPFFFALLILSSAALALAHRISCRLAAVLSAALAAVPLAMYIQGSFFSSYLPALDGEPVDWSLFRSQRTVSVVLWGGLLLIALIVSLKKDPEAVHRLSRIISLTGTAFLAVTLCVTLLSGRTLKKPKLASIGGHWLPPTSSAQPFGAINAKI